MIKEVFLAASLEKIMGVKMLITKKLQTFTSPTYEKWFFNLTQTIKVSLYDKSVP